MAAYDDYIDRRCPECGEQLHYKVVDVKPMGEVSRRGPSCWMASCTQYQTNRP